MLLETKTQLNKLGLIKLIDWSPDRRNKKVATVTEANSVKLKRLSSF